MKRFKEKHETDQLKTSLKNGGSSHEIGDNVKDKNNHRRLILKMKKAHEKYFDVKVRQNKDEMIKKMFDPRF